MGAAASNHLTMLLPFKAKNPPESFPYGTCGLIVVNVLVYVLTSNYGLVAKSEVVKQWGLSGVHSEPMNWLASLFLHGDIFHILGNMWFLYLFGFAVEGRLRTAKFLFLYFAAGFTGSAAHYFAFSVSEPTIPSIGASGAIMGLLGAALFMFPFAQMAFFLWIGLLYTTVFVWPMWGVGLWYLGFDAVMALIGGASSGVAHLAHLGGAAGGFLVAMAMRPRRDSAETSEAKAIASDADDLGVLSSRELAAMQGSNPDDPWIALHWMHRSLRDAQGVKPECQAAFLRLLPRMREFEPSSVAFCVASLAIKPGVVPVASIADVAYRVERVGEYALAVRLLDAVVQDPASRPADVESALLRIGILCETALANPHRAMAAYQEVVRRFELSPLADQARARAKGMIDRGYRP